jgi:hypothetical protein
MPPWWAEIYPLHELFGLVLRFARTPDLADKRVAASSSERTLKGLSGRKIRRDGKSREISVTFIVHCDAVDEFVDAPAEVG